MSWLNRFKEKFSSSEGDDFEDHDVDEEGYVQVTQDQDKKTKISVRPFVLGDFADVKPVLDTLREGYTVALVNIKPLKDRDLVELKRAVNKLKKTCEAVEGDIAGFGEDWIAITPSFAQIYREKPKPKQPQSTVVYGDDF